MVLFKEGKEVARYTGYNGEKEKFWQWLGFQLLTPEQQKLPLSRGRSALLPVPTWMKSVLASLLIPSRAQPCSSAKLNSTVAPVGFSFIEPVEGSVTYHADNSGYMQRIEVRSASSGIHLGHVFNDGCPDSQTLLH